MTEPTTLQWSEALSLDMPLMDTTHQEFVELLADVVRAPDETLLSKWAILIDHTDDHFGVKTSGCWTPALLPATATRHSTASSCRSCVKAANAAWRAICLWCGKWP